MVRCCSSCGHSGLNRAWWTASVSHQSAKVLDVAIVLRTSSFLELRPAANRGKGIFSVSATAWWRAGCGEVAFFNRCIGLGLPRFGVV